MFGKFVGLIKSTNTSRPSGAYSLEEICAGDEYSSDELDQLFHILRNQRRRDVLRYLSTASKQVTVSDLAEHIAARECEKPIAQLKSQERKRVYIGLYQGHLPKLDACGVLSFDSDRGTIEPGPALERFEQFLPDTEDPAVETHSVSGSPDE